MAAIKTASSAQVSPQYHTTDAHNNAITLAALDSTGFITIGTPSVFVVLNKQAAFDLITALTNFANTGVLS